MAELDWSDLKVILALSRGGSVAAAARLLGVDSSTVSRRLAAAEEAFGACLVLRGGREFRLTAEGNLVKRTAEATEAAILSALSAVKSAKQNLEGKVRITAVVSFYHLLYPLCEIVHAQYPKLHLEISDTDAMVNLATGDADIGFRMAPPKEPDLVARKACELGWAVYASKDYAAHYGLPKCEEALRDHRLILYSESRHHMQRFAWLEQFRTTDDRYTRVNTTSVALRSVLSGVGIGTLPCYEGDQHASLVRVFAKPFHYHDGYVVYHESLRDSASIRAVADEMVRYLHGKKAVLTGIAD